MRLNGLTFTLAESRTILEYFATYHGLAPKKRNRSCIWLSTGLSTRRIFQMTMFVALASGERPKPSGRVRGWPFQRCVQAHLGVPRGRAGCASERGPSRTIAAEST
jgi:hypothetical protein